ncbi:hypothetical protein NESM_000211000 [Novymonas esmeraldas]|uniref:Uncharacterized protein n=1 Tax=Novymonas esmeraldas TaxID=1808958 RepID=A0AAW0F920_9TRYP
MSNHASSSTTAAPNVSAGTVGTTAQQADNLTRNFILGIPKGGLAADSPEAADLQAAEAFVSDIQQEILAYDIANARAMEAYAVRWWSAVPLLGRHARRALKAEQEEQARRASEAAGTASASPAASGLRISQAEAAAAAELSGGTYMHRQTSQTSRGLKVERTSAIQRGELSALAGAPLSNPAAPTVKANTWLFRRQHPGWVPLMQRWWVPWLCVGSIAVLWTPDVWKLRTLYVCDHQYALFRQAIHKAYWRATMSPEDYAALMADIEAERPTKVASTNCPFD